MSSIETGSSATSSTGLRMIARAITARCFCPPERSPGYLSMNCSAGREPDALERLRHAPPDACLVAWRCRGSAAGGRPTARSSSPGSATRAGPGRPSASAAGAAAARARGSPAMLVGPRRRRCPRSPGRGRAASGRASSCRCRTRRRGRAPRPCARSSETSSTALTEPASRPDRAGRGRCRGSSSSVFRSRTETSGAVAAAPTAAAQASSATASSSRSSGSRPSVGDLAPPARAASTATRWPLVEPRPRPGRARADAHRVRAARVEAAAARRVDEVRRRAGDRVQLRRRERDRRAQQLARVRVRRLGEHVAGRPLLDDLARVHDRDPVARLGDDPEVVGDQQERRVEVRLQVGEDPEDLRLDDHVERRRRLVGDEQLRPRAPARARS